MKVLQVPFGYFPDVRGGTEVYVRALSKSLQKKGVSVVVAAPGERNEEYLYEETPTYRYRVEEQDLRGLYGTGCPVTATRFRQLLEIIKPDLVNLHAFTPGVSQAIVETINRANLPVVLTYHTPTVTCMRGTLLKNGKVICNGFIDDYDCAACVLNAKGLPSFIAEHLVMAAPSILTIANNYLPKGRIQTALQIKTLVSMRHEAFSKLIRQVDRFVAVCEWASRVLVINGVDKDRISVIRQGLAVENSKVASRSRLKKAIRTQCRFVFLGRLAPEKGLDLLLAALARMPRIALTLDIYGIEEAEGNLYAKKLRKLIDQEPRAKLLAAVSSDNIVELLRNYDCLLTPSQCLETGPLVVYEAFAARVPVIGSNLGGIAELVSHERNGLLVAYDDVNAWEMAIRRFCEEPELAAKLAEGILPPRTMEDAALEILEIYKNLIRATV